MSAGEDPRAELAGLARGLASHLRRQARLGLARADRPPAPPETQARPGTGPAGAEREVLVERPRPSPPRPPTTRPPTTRPPTTRPSGPASQRPAEPAAREPAAAAEAGPELAAQAGRTEELAAANRTRAAACADLEALRAAVADCTACGLCETRTQTVFADGTGRAGVMFIGEGPGFHEDQAGVPFVGRAGALLTDIVTKGMGLAREDVYIANVVKCRPPDNRDPSPAEKAICTPWLDRQIELLKPAVLVPLGRHAAGHVLGSQASMGAMRGRVHGARGLKVVPTYHPAYLLRSPSQKKACWADIQMAMGELGLPIARGADRAGGPQEAGDGARGDGGSPGASSNPRGGPG